MHTLTIDPIYPYILGEVARVVIALVGCGGTGSHIAQSLARMAAHSRDTGGPQIDLIFIDGDRIEAKNVGRQLFASSEVGQNKAQTLAARFGAAFGLRIAAWPEFATEDSLMEYAYTGCVGNVRSILVGAVDSAEGRQAIQKSLANFRECWDLWIDAGNHEHAGQVVVGSATKIEHFHAVLKLGLCSQLPAASVLYPELLEPQPQLTDTDCAAAMQNNAQSLMVNQMMASIVGQYLYQIIFQRRLTQFATTVDLQTLAMRSLSITARELAAAVGLSEAELRGEVVKKSRKKAA